MNEEIQEMESFMLVQFIDVLDILEKYNLIEEVRHDIRNRKRIYLEYIKKNENKNFWFLDLNKQSVNQKIEKASQLYMESDKYKEILKKLEVKYEELIDRFSIKDKLDEIKDLIYELCDFDIDIAYKVGMLEGLKINALNEYFD